MATMCLTIVMTIQMATVSLMLMKVTLIPMLTAHQTFAMKIQTAMVYLMLMKAALIQMVMVFLTSSTQILTIVLPTLIRIMTAYLIR